MMPPKGSPPSLPMGDLHILTVTRRARTLPCALAHRRKLQSSGGAPDFLCCFG